MRETPALPSWRARAPVALGLLLVAAACHKAQPSADAGSEGGAPASSASSTVEPSVIARAEDTRRSADVPASSRTSRNVVERRRAARALARIGDGASATALLALLVDDDAEVVTWAAYGLGFACKGREEAHVKALVARAASRPSATPASDARGPFSPALALARAVGKCATPLAEDVLSGWLKGDDELSVAAAFGLGDLAVKRKSLRPETVTALAQAASRPGMSAVFHPLARVVPDLSNAPTVLSAARAELSRPSDHRILAIKSLGKLGKDAASDLSGVVVADKGYTGAERAEAARALGLLGDAGRAAAAEALVKMVPDRDPLFLESLVGPMFGVVSTLIDALGDDPPKRAEAVLMLAARLAPPPGTAQPPGLAARLEDVRCAAALALAKGAFDTELLTQCAPEGSFAFERARLRALARRPLTGPRKAAFLALAASKHVRIRELAVESLAAHPELGDAAHQVVAEALASDKGGLVATAADAASSHPERLLVLSAKEKRAALDPRAPPPTANPEKELAPAIGKALEAALARSWPPDRFETRLSLLDAAVALGLPSAKALAQKACTDENVTVRERAQKALKTLGQAATCEAGEKTSPASEVGASPEAVVVRLTLPTARLSLRLEPDLSPVTVARVTALARAGFYKGIVVHRVVPGFVLQLGDPDGDGYGGSGKPLRCETSPVPFAAGDVGMALAGRDTGSSQVFVTLSRTPHLDGEYTRLGRAEGDFDKIKEGDVVTDVVVDAPK